jgi:hypothetical protein
MPPDYPLLIDNLKEFAPIIYQIIPRAASRRRWQQSLDRRGNRSGAASHLVG